MWIAIVWDVVWEWFGYAMLCYWYFLGSNNVMVGLWYCVVLYRVWYSMVYGMVLVLYSMGYEMIEYGYNVVWYRYG